MATTHNSAQDGKNANDQADGARDRHRGAPGGRSAGPSMGLGDIFDRLVGDENSVKSQIDRNAKALAQSALSKLDVVSRSEFDAQRAVLERTRNRVSELESELERLSAIIDANHKDS